MLAEVKAVLVIFSERKYVSKLPVRV